MRDTKYEVLHFWFEEAEPVQWFQKNEAFDEDIKARFLTTYDMARKDFCADWNRDADGSLALCLVLDQFPRNMFRYSPKAFETDAKALMVSKEALHKGFDRILSAHKRRFIYMPFMHSENMDDQNRSVTLFETMKDKDPLSYEYACKHKEVIEKFGRFPHRNGCLGRTNSLEEQEYLDNLERPF